MVEDITAANCGDIANAAFRRHAQMYVDIQADFEEAVAQFGLQRESGEGAFTRAGFDARDLEPQAYTRLYTSGAGLDAAYARELAATGLDEVRFSVKLDEPAGAVDETLERMRLCAGLFERVMVEMPVMPDQVDEMKRLLVRLDAIGCAGINLLELCFPFHNAAEFARRGYRLKASPYRVLYDYWYSGGLPVAGSEQACLDVLEWAVDEGLGMGVHYCSLENKLTGQVYQQNAFAPLEHPRHELSGRDYFLKSAKVFGADRDVASRILRAQGVRALQRTTPATFDYPHDL